MSTFKRSDRVAESIQRKLSVLIRQEVKDPALPAFITISSVKLTSDLSMAKVYFTVFDADVVKTAAILNASASCLRSALAKILTTRSVPALHFIYDDSVEYGRKLSNLIDKVVKLDSENENEIDNPQSTGLENAPGNTIDVDHGKD